ncbi:ATP-binding protein [Lacticaseibacillus suihuaensis]
MTNSESQTKQLLSRPEGKSFDRKSSAYDLIKLANILIAFANADGGTVAVGIKNKTFEGIDQLSNQKINDMLQIGNQLVVPTLPVSDQFMTVDDYRGKKNRILLLTVEPAEGIIYANKRDEVFLRIGDETHKATFEERKNLEYDRGIRAYESQIIEDALLSDLDDKTVAEYKRLYQFDGDTLWDLLFPKGLAKRIRTASGNATYRLTVAGVLLLASEPTAFIPGARIRFVRYEGKTAQTGTQMNVVKQTRIEGPLTSMLTQTSDLIESQLRTFSSLDVASGKFTEVPEYPKGAWLEGIVNAVTHRGYNYTGDDIRVLMFDDHIEIHSPGGLPAVVTPENIRKTHYSRNPYIARALTDFGWVREFGEGVERIYRDMNAFFLEDPEYDVDTNSVNLILKNNIVMRSFRREDAIQARIGRRWAQLTEIERVAVEMAYERGSVRTRELFESINQHYSLSSARNALRHLTELAILEKVATSPTSPNQYYRLTGAD